MGSRAARNLQHAVPTQNMQHGRHTMQQAALATPNVQNATYHPQPATQRATLSASRATSTAQRARQGKASTHYVRGLILGCQGPGPPGGAFSLRPSRPQLCRWGRAQEVPGECPYLTGEYAAAIVAATQQGPEDPRYRNKGTDDRNKGMDDRNKGTDDRNKGTDDRNKGTDDRKAGYG